ncbi:MAG: hypothetical protein M1504_02375 [Candidatus Marsarchaeota archaeon]|nr:hypothetical protein [Candidatus Marsarchaeota archaeon]
MELITLLFAIVTITTFGIYLVDLIESRKLKPLLYIAASIIVGLAVVYVLRESINETTVFFVSSLVVIFSMIPYYYMKSTSKMLLFLAIAILEFIYATFSYGTLLFPFVQMFAIGTGMGFWARSGTGILTHRHKRASKLVETKRDTIHISLGIVLLLLFVFLRFYDAVYVTMGLVFLAYIYNSMLGKRGKGIIYSALSSMERTGALYGMGALYLGIGTAILLGFIHTTSFAIVGIAALFFADPIATIVGVNLGSIKLPYNRKKSVVGTIAFFIVTSIAAYFAVGFYGLEFGAVLAIIESLDIPIDDNVLISIAMVVMYIVFLAVMNQLPF